MNTRGSSHLRIITALLISLWIAPVRAGEAPLPAEVSFGGKSYFNARAVAVSDDGRIALSDSGSAIVVWDIRTSRSIRRMVGHGGNVNSVVILANGRQAVSGSDDKTLKLWDLASGKPIKTLAGFKYGISAIALFGDNHLVAADGGGNIQIVQLDTFQVVHKLKAYSFLKSVSASADGALIFDSDFLGMHIWDGRSGEKLRTIDGQTGPLALSPDGNVVASAGNKVVKLLRASNGTPLSTLSGHQADVSAVSFSPDGSLLATGARDGTIRVWRVNSGETLASYHVGNTVNSMSILADGRSVLVGTLGGTPAVQLLNLFSGEMVRPFSGGWNGVPSVGFAQQDHSIFFTSGAVHFADASTGAVVRRVGDRISVADLSPDGKTLLTGTVDNAVQLREAASGAILRSLGAHKAILASVDISPDGKRGLSAGLDGVLNLWNLEDGALIRTMSAPNSKSKAAKKSARYSNPFDNPNGILKARFSPDGKTAVTVGQSENLRTWNLASGKLERVFVDPHPRPYVIPDVQWAPDGQTIYSATDNGIRQWDAKTGRLIRTLQGKALSLSISLDGKLAVSSGPDSSISVWDLETGKLLRSLIGHSQEAFSVGISSDSRSVVSSSSDGTVILWDIEKSAPLTRTLVANPSNWITVTIEGFFNASSPAAAQNLNVVRGLEVYSIDQVYQALYRPDLVREKLAGDPKGLVREAAAKLDLNKVIASGAAPRVLILTPAGKVNSDEIVVEAQVAEQNGGGIGKIEWRVNGVTLGVESRGLERLPESSGFSPVASRPPVMVKRTLALEPGENRIEVVAYNGRDLIASDPAQVVLKWDGEKNTTPPKLHVLAVGVNDYYDSRLRLSYAVPDAKSLGDAFKRAGNSLYQSVDVTSVLDDKVTVDNLDQVFTELGKKVHPRDVFVFFLAGHGKTVDGRYHFLPQNFRYEDENSIVKRGIDQERFQAWFAKIPARKSILLYDTCESGSLTGDRVQQRGIERVAALEKMTRAMGRTVLSASSDDAPALEGYHGHGVFTYALLDGLQAADTNGNGLIEVTELAAFVDQKVPDLSYQAFKLRQIPQMKIVGSSFPVVSKTSVLRASDAAASNATAIVPIPAKPTHVVISTSPVDVYAAATHGGAAVHQLVPGTTVTLIETNNGWQLIAKDGRKLGYVEEKMLTKLQ